MRNNLKDGAATRDVGFKDSRKSCQMFLRFAKFRGEGMDTYGTSNILPNNTIARGKFASLRARHTVTDSQSPGLDDEVHHKAEEDADKQCILQLQRRL